MLSNDEGIAKFKEIIGSKDGWQYLKESQFLNHLAIFASWALRSAQFGTERAIQEYFLSTALNKSSIMAHAEDRGYVPRKAAPSTGTVSITNSGTATVTVPEYQALKSNNGLDYLLTSVADILPGQSVEREISQLYRQTVTHTVTETKPYYEVAFDVSLSESISRIDVAVDLNDGAGPAAWTMARLFQNTLPASTVYDEFFSHSGQYGIRFGNDEFGRIIPAGAVVTIVLWLTGGDTVLIPGQQLSISETLLDLSGGIASLDILTTSQVIGGTKSEVVDELRKNLLYWPIYQEQLVWQEDYEFFIKKKIPAILWVNVWGEKEAEKAAGRFDYSFINKIFISAYAKDYPDLGADIMAALDSVSLLNRSFEWVPPLVSHFTVSISGVVSPSVSTVSAIDTIKTVLTENYGLDSAARRKSVTLKDLYAIVEATGLFKSGYYTIVLSGKSEPEALNELLAIDTDNSVITLSN